MWRRVTYKHPCPICGKTDWCAISQDGSVVKCMRINLGAFTEKEDAGGLAYYHQVKENIQLPPPTPKKPKRSSHELYAIHQKALKNLYNCPSRLERSLGHTLGLPQQALRSIGLGILTAEDLAHAGMTSRDSFVWSFPMRDWKGYVVGLRLRSQDGAKFALSGGTDGMFRSNLNLSYQKMYVVEGPTDCAACLAMGYQTVGRPNNTGGWQDIVKFAEEKGTKEVVVVLDNDPESKQIARKQTLKGGNKLVMALTSSAIRAKACYIEGSKDAREQWKEGLRELKLKEIVR